MFCHLADFLKDLGTRLRLKGFHFINSKIVLYSGFRNGQQQKLMFAFFPSVHTDVVISQITCDKAGTCFHKYHKCAWNENSYREQEQ